MGRTKPFGLLAVLLSAALLGQLRLAAAQEVFTTQFLSDEGDSGDCVEMYGNATYTLMTCGQMTCDNYDYDNDNYEAEYIDVDDEGAEHVDFHDQGTDFDERDLDIIYLDRNNEWNDFWIYYGYNNDSDFDEGLDIGFNKHYNFNDDFNSDKSDQRHEFGFEFSFWNLDRIFYCYPGNFNHYGLYF
ncbi:unnamed protein product, partial [Mesorhabditis spiculigera]